MGTNNRRIVTAILLVGIMAFQCLSASVDSSISVSYLRCEYKDSPEGIDITNPRLSWIVESDLRGQSQTAYRVIVARSEKMLADDKGDLWDSGRVLSDETTSIVYQGKPLA